MLRGLVATAPPRDTFPLPSHTRPLYPPHGCNTPLQHGREGDSGGRGWALGIPGATWRLCCVTIQSHPKQRECRNETRWSSWHVLNAFLWVKWTLLGDSEHWKKQYIQVHLGISIGSVSNGGWNLRKTAVPACPVEVSVMVEVLYMHAGQSTWH